MVALKPKRRILVLVLIVFFLNLILVSPEFVPLYRDINPYDEAKYIESGRYLLQGQLREPEWGPLVAIVYAPIYLLVQQSPYWFFYSLVAGRLVLFTLLWFGLYRLGVRFAKDIPAVLPVGLLAISFVGAEIVKNPSDAFFAFFSLLAFDKTIAYIQSPENRHLTCASIFLGLGTLVRNDGFLVFAIFVLIALVLAFRGKIITKVLVPILLPYLLIIGAYYLIHGIQSGNFSFGTRERTYFAFEQGQWVVDVSDWTQAPDRARQLYGTPEENNYNILTAITHNPQAYLIRIKAIIRMLPTIVLFAYGGRTAMLFGVLSIIGILALIRQRNPLLIILLLWPLHLIIYFLTFFRPGYLLLPFFTIFVLASVGITHLAVKQISYKEKIFWSILFIAGMIYFWLAGLERSTSNLIVLLAGLWLIWLSSNTASQLSSDFSHISMLVMLAIGLIIRGGYAFPYFNTYQDAAETRGIGLISKKLPQYSNIISATPLPAVASRMINADLPENLESSDDLYLWLLQEDVQLIFVDNNMREDVNLMQLLEPIQDRFDIQVLSTDTSTVDIWWVESP